MIHEGVQYNPSTDTFTFNWESDSPEDLIDLVKIRKKTSTKSGIQYYVPFVALPKGNKYTNEYKQAMNSFRKKLKDMTLPKSDLDRMVDTAIDGFIEVEGNRLDDIGVIVTPKSKSTLNRKISARLKELLPNATLADDVFVKSTLDKITINAEKIKGDPEIREKTLQAVTKMLDKMKERGEFNLKSIHPKYRNLFSNFITINQNIDLNLYDQLQTENILVVDDYLTKGFTMKEINTILLKNKSGGDVINFVLLLQG
jgi:hypothetical protein